MTALVNYMDGAPLDTQVVIGMPTDTVWSTCFYMDMPPLFANDVLIYSCRQEIANTVTYNTECVTQLILCPTWCRNDIDMTPDGYMIDETIGNDASLNPIHYWCANSGGPWRVPADMPVSALQFRARCRSTAAPGTDAAIIKPGYGHLRVALYRG